VHQWIVHRDHRIKQDDKIRSSTDRVDFVGRLVDLVGKPRPEKCRQVAASGEAHHPDARGVDAIGRRLAADHAHGALRVLQRHVLRVVVAFTGQPILEKEHRDPAGREPTRHFAPLLVQYLAHVTTPRSDDERRAVALGRNEDGQAGAGNSGYDPIEPLWIGAALGDRLGDRELARAGRRPRPKWKRCALLYRHGYAFG
jgi:hypothetical protein